MRPRPPRRKTDRMSPPSPHAPSEPSRRHALALTAAAAAVLLTGISAPARRAEAAETRPIRLVALGDSLTAGYRLPKGKGFAPRLEAALKAAGHHVEVIDAGVSGDTTDQGLARLDWSVPADADAVIVELGANDALRGLPPAIARRNLDEIVGTLRKRGVAVLVAGMLAPRNLGEAYAAEFDRIFPEVAAAHGSLLYPFFLDGVALEPRLLLDDGLHPDQAGVEEIVRRILPSVVELLARVPARS